MANTKLQIANHEQRSKVKLHHEERLAWLSKSNPTWSCGTPVSKSQILQMTRASKEAIRLINLGMTPNA